MEKNGLEFDKTTEKFKINDSKIQQVVNQLAKELLMIEALGDYAGAKNLIEKYRYISPEMQICLDQLKDIAVDIRPVYSIEKNFK